MTRMKLIGGLIFVGLASMANTAGAAITSEVTINFDTILFSSYKGKGNIAPAADPSPAPVAANCTGSGPSGCYTEQGVTFGIVNDTSEFGSTESHLHRVDVLGGRRLGYDSDSSGIYIRTLDSTAFSLSSMGFYAPIIPTNNQTGPNDYWEILGFNTALNPNLDTGNGTDYPTRVAYQSVLNGFDSDVSGALLLNSDFQNVNGVWIHYKGYTQYPIDGIAFSMRIDNVVLSAPVAAVPVPAAAWLFGSGLMGLVSFARRKARQA